MGNKERKLQNALLMHIIEKIVGSQTNNRFMNIGLKNDFLSLNKVRHQTDLTKLHGAQLHVQRNNSQKIFS